MLAATQGIRMIRNSYRNNLLTDNLSKLRSRAGHVLQHALLSSFTLALLFCLGLTLAAGAPAHAQKVSEKNLPPSYRQWLDRDVTYFITKEERDTFLRLTTDDARDKFIE